jgi:hypothetical protein
LEGWREVELIMNQPTQQQNYWQEFFEILKERISKPCNHPTFVMYFIGIIIIAGGFGLTDPLIRHLLGGSVSNQLIHSLVSASYTYFVAIAATAAVDLILSYHKRKFLLMFFLLYSLAIYACAILAAICLTNHPTFASILSAIGYIAALLLWWIGNAENANLLDTPVKASASIVADDDIQPSGNLNGFNT